MNTFFTIIIPARKLNRYLIDETLPSLENQLFKNFETIIVIDHPDTHDKTFEKKYSWLKIVSNLENNRPGNKRDHAAAIAKGKILAFIDDDVYAPVDWLKKTHDLFIQNKDVAALGGPGILPEKVNIWERIFDAVLKTWIGSGRYVYRFTPKAEQYVDDYPTMNLMMRKDIFLKLGGFDNHYWPGEDSKLLNKFHVEEKKYILYHPEALVFHHRRDSLLGHLEQHKNYGKTRGTFAAQNDQNSMHFMYIVPALFTIYIFILSLLHLISRGNLYLEIFTQFFTAGLYLYFGLLFYVFFQTFLRTENMVIAFGSAIVIPMTHLTYGVFYVIGYIREKFIS